MRSYVLPTLFILHCVSFHFEISPEIYCLDYTFFYGEHWQVYSLLIQELFEQLQDRKILPTKMELKVHKRWQRSSAGNTLFSEWKQITDINWQVLACDKSCSVLGSEHSYQRITSLFTGVPVSSDPSTVRGRYSSQSSDMLTESLAALFQSTEQ